jgi:hypothetical protein
MRRRFLVAGGLGCGTVVLILAAVGATLAVKACPGDVARWTGRPQGRVVVRPGMTKAAVRREATTRIGEYGDSGRFVEFDLPAAGLVLPGIAIFSVDAGKDGRVDHVNMIGANESWPDLRDAAIATEERLLAGGWVPEAGQASVRSLTTDPRASAAGITESGVIANLGFSYAKGEQRFRLSAGGLWGGIPRWRDARRARVFYRRMDYLPIGETPAVEAVE